ncbi:hypothetical protein CsSME_00025735 [Camellia sinensis var. sinensis]
MIWKFPLISSTILRLQLHSLKVISPLWLFLHGMTMDKNSLCRILVSSFGAWIDMLYRSDFFPGLGWMLAKSTWDELSPKWTKAYWDDWLRLKETHKGRQFIRPEVCRTYNFGEHGSSLGQYFKQYLEPIKLNGVQACEHFLFYFFA